MRIGALGLCAVLGGLAGCATVGLEPAPSASLVSGREDAAYATTAGVRVTVSSRSWRADPPDLPRVLTPVEVTIENDSGRPLRVRYQDFVLVGGGGFRYAAIPPLATGPAASSPRSERAPAPAERQVAGGAQGSIEARPTIAPSLVLAAGDPHRASPVQAPPPSANQPAPPARTPPPPGDQPEPPRQREGPRLPPPPAERAPPPAVEQAPAPPPAPSSRVHPASPVRPAPPREVVVISRPRFYSHRFWVSPLYEPYYPHLHVWPGPFAWDPYYYDRYYAGWPRPLPSRDMLERALPEGVLDPGGRVSGFLYFPNVRREPAVVFRYELADARSGEVFGTVEIPFVMSR